MVGAISGVSVFACVEAGAFFGTVVRFRFCAKTDGEVKTKTKASKIVDTKIAFFSMKLERKTVLFKVNIQSDKFGCRKKPQSLQRSGTSAEKLVEFYRNDL